MSDTEYWEMPNKFGQEHTHSSQTKQSPQPKTLSTLHAITKLSLDLKPREVF